MRINETQRMNAIHSYHKNKDSVTPQNTKQTEKLRDEVQISQEAKELLGAQQSAEAAGLSRKQRLEELKRAISDGTYRIDAEKLADKLLPYMKD